ncbi:hypothetical protein AX15_006704 [Amanita polypyramis BW_CC]|nr:hypothetical protein AX15_006704 [Amanita polypyramis BW_CC]
MATIIAPPSSSLVDLEAPATATPSPVSTPRTLRRKSHLRIFRSCPTDDDSIVDGKCDDIQTMMNSSSNVRRPKSDPFGDIVRSRNPADIPPMPVPGSSMQTQKRLRAATTSAVNQLYSQPCTPTTPTFSALSGPISPTHPKPLYSAIRKNGVCLSPPLPSPPYTASVTTSPVHSSGNVDEYSASHGYGYASPASSVFPLYPPAAETMLLSLSLDSRPSSSSTSSSSSDQHDVFGPLMMLRAKCGCGNKSKPKFGSKTQRERKRDKARTKAAGRRSISGESMRSNTQMRMESNPGYQRVFQAPVGPGTGCSMSGEPELKLALAQQDKRASTPSPMSKASTTARTRRGDHAKVDVNEPGSPGSKVGGTIRRLREMVSRTF